MESHFPLFLLSPLPCTLLTPPCCPPAISPPPPSPTMLSYRLCVPVPDGA